MDLKSKYITSNVPMWCQNLEESALVEVHQKGIASYALDTDSPFPLKKGFFSNSQHVFRFRYVNSQRDQFYFLAIAKDVPKINRSTLRSEFVPGVEILKCVLVRNGTLSEHLWQDDMLPFQGSSDPIFKVADAAKRYEKASPPLYLAFID